MKPSQIPDAYKRLNVPQDASLREIKQAYRTMVNRWHYDRQPENREEFIAVCEAYAEIRNRLNTKIELAEDLIKLAFQIRMMGGRRK